MEDKIFIEKDKEGSLKINKAFLENTSLNRHEEYIVYEENGSIVVVPSIHSLSRVYIEPTSACNLNCVTCIRKTWHENTGFMDMDVFESLVSQIKEIKTIESVMFGGFGEPMFHDEIIYMIKALKKIGLKVSITTNGTMLYEKTIRELIDANLDELWVSIDSTETEKFNELREGADFSEIYENLKLFKAMNHKNEKKTMLGIAFVVTKDNVKDLSKLRSFASSVWAEKISVSNVIPYDSIMEEKMLCKRKLFKPLAYREDEEDRLGFKEIIIPEISLPKIDYNEDTKEGLYNIYSSMMKVKILGESFKEYKDHCRFINDRITFIRWDGAVSPCMGLLHSYTTFLNGNERHMKEYSLGSIKDSSLKKIWNGEEYRIFRENVYKFEFSPCVLCGGCEDVDSNEKDCMTNIFPACGGCLWAQGVIQCP
jgi:MoaA/NifB/PqqE/SkfB family radical SAM enzyme